MKDSKTALLDAVKTTVSLYGLEDFSTRKLADTAGINNGLIYHYFKNKEDLLLTAYCRENGSIFTAITHNLEEIHGIPFTFRDKARLSFHRTWREFLSDPDRLTFCNRYYHSIYFNAAAEFHEEQLTILTTRLGRFFPSKESCAQTMYSLMVILYDSAQRIIGDPSLDTPEMEEMAFASCFGLLCSQIKPEFLA